MLFGIESSELKHTVPWKFDWHQSENVNREKHAVGLRAKVRNRLKGAEITKKPQANVFQACVQRTVPFDKAACMWYDTKSLQSRINCCYRHIWCNKKEPLLF